ncbi:hypothetical protein Aros01_07687 [Streptosporangium roseum]|uniref:Uncharacterized protein n=1 Tax=Streptosporangium roseum (strain ATCC 12428 / DSM 43021 / JCM 3005 / KCTC 9067 / NCIMB 10171 / NRRL 2505 / NI 9100) TaxID=479432 RepID=D2BB43_STRRD|nr:hypothetical protein Sros_9188 [Streptosporangium roseum DSM 43021]
MVRFGVPVACSELLAGRLTVEEFAMAIRVVDDLGVTVHPIGADHLERAGPAVRLTLRMYDAVFARPALDRI